MENEKEREGERNSIFDSVAVFSRAIGSATTHIFFSPSLIPFVAHKNRSAFIRNVREKSEHRLITRYSANIYQIPCTPFDLIYVYVRHVLQKETVHIIWYRLKSVNSSVKSEEKENLCQFF